MGRAGWGRKPIAAVQHEATRMSLDMHFAPHWLRLQAPAPPASLHSLGMPSTTIFLDTRYVQRNELLQLLNILFPARYTVRVRKTIVARENGPLICARKRSITWSSLPHATSPPYLPYSNHSHFNYTNVISIQAERESVMQEQNAPVN